MFFCCSFFLKSQSCYFLKDTGTVNVETSNSLIELGDGSIYVAGTQGNGPYGGDDMALLKFDACGNLLWTKFYGDTLSNQILFINKTSNGRLVTIGVTGNTQNANDILFQKLDTAGNVLLQKRYSTRINQSAKFIQQTSDKGFIFCGLIADNYGSNDSYVVKIDSSGIVQWSQQIGGNLNEYADNVREMSDGNYIMTGDANSYGAGNYDVEVVKFDKSGNIIWDHTYGDNLDNGCQGIIELSSGKYLSYGETNVHNSIAFDFFTQIIDTNGNGHTRYTFGGTAADAIFSIVELSNKELMCTGYSRSYNGFTDYDVVIFKADTAGNIKWLKNIYNPGIDIGYEILPSINGNYLVTGLFGDNNDNYFLIHSDTIPNTSVGIKSNSDENGFNFYPNPCNEVLTIDLTSENYQNTSIDFINVLGQKVKTVILSEKTINIQTENIPSGIYTIVIKRETGLPLSKKLLINH